MRKKIMAANWKMNCNKQQAENLIGSIKDTRSDLDVVICPPYTLLQTVSEKLLGTGFKLGAQNMHYKESGAFTGEIAPDMLLDFGVSYVILGHSERRQYDNETDEDVNKKVVAARKHGLIPIICVGESLATRQSGNEKSFVTGQVRAALSGIKQSDKVVFAYEPIWSIGTGLAATPEQAGEMIAAIREEIDSCGMDGQRVSILYGGSMNEKNVRDLMAKEEIDGGLIGSASLVGEKFNKLLTYNK